MSGTIDQNQAAADVPAEPEGFFFNLRADETGITEFRFRKEERVINVLMFAAEYINQSFDTPFPCVGDFFRHLGGAADQIEAALKQQQEQGNERASEAANDAGPEAPEAA